VYVVLPEVLSYESTKVRKYHVVLPYSVQRLFYLRLQLITVTVVTYESTFEGTKVLPEVLPEVLYTYTYTYSLQRYQFAI